MRPRTRQSLSQLWVGLGVEVAHPGKLKAISIQRTTAVGLHSDGGGLYLQVTKSSKGVISRSWIYRYMIHGRSREMGLGSTSIISLQEARNLATECRKQRHNGLDPIEERRGERQRSALQLNNAITFESAAKSYVEAHRAGWRNSKHAAQWSSTLAKYAFPQFGKLSVRLIDTNLVLRVLEPMWSSKPETANRLRGRIESILNWSAIRGYRSGENPARWRGHLDQILPAKSKVRVVRHHPSLPYSHVPSFMRQLIAIDTVGACALQFAILTAVRTGEVLGARWSEIDLQNQIWVIPAHRMKAGRPHRVPLSSFALRLLNAQRPYSELEDAFIFRGRAKEKPLSNMAMTMLIRGLNPSITVHGFRSSFRDWVAERTNFSYEAAEIALAHAVGSKVEAAYLRTDMFNRRRRMMSEWAEFCESGTSVASPIVALRAAGR